MQDLRALICLKKAILLLGDFNICYKSNRSNLIFDELRKLGFQQLVKKATHTEGGVIDLVFFLEPKDSYSYYVIQTSQFFTDHDLIEIYKGKEHMIYTFCANLIFVRRLNTGGSHNHESVSSSMTCNISIIVTSMNKHKIFFYSFVLTGS